MAIFIALYSWSQVFTYKFFIFPGDDAIGVKWTDMDSNLDLYASHVDFVQKVAELRQAAW